MDYMWDNILKLKKQEHSISRSLKKNILFRDLSFREIRFVEKIVHERIYKKGETIFRQGEAGVGMYIIASGSVNIYVDDRETSSTSPGESYLITELGAGDFFGEIALIEPSGARTASAFAAEDTKLIGFFRPDLMELIARNPNIGVKVSMTLAEVLGLRLKETTERISLIKRELKRLKAEKKIK